MGGHAGALTPDMASMGQVLGVDPRLIERLLSDHATLLRRLAPQQREASIAIRREEITALSDLLGEPPAEVIDRLGNLIGADHEQRATMLKLFAAGALVIGLAATGMVYGRGRAASGAGDAPLKPALAPTEIVEVIETPTLGEPLAVVALDAGSPESQPAAPSPAPGGGLEAAPGPTVPGA